VHSLRPTHTFAILVMRLLAHQVLRQQIAEREMQRLREQEQQEHERDALQKRLEEEAKAAAAREEARREAGRSYISLSLSLHPISFPLSAVSLCCCQAICRVLRVAACFLLCSRSQHKGGATVVLRASCTFSRDRACLRLAASSRRMMEDGVRANKMAAEAKERERLAERVEELKIVEYLKEKEVCGPSCGAP